MRTIRTAKNRERFLHVLRKTGNVTMAARAIKSGRRSLYDWRADDATFQAAWEEVLAEYADTLELEADRRATRGVKKGVYHRGKLVGFQREYSDILLIFRLKALRPEMYRERQELLHEVGTSITNLAQRLQAAHAAAEERRSGGTLTPLP